MFGLVLLLALSAPTQLEEDPDYVKGRELYRDLEFEQAVFRFQAVAIKPSLSPKEQATAFMWLGLCYAGVPNNDLAKQAFRDAARLDPEVKMPIKSAPPSVVELFEAARTEAGQASTPPPDTPETTGSEAPISTPETTSTETTSTTSEADPAATAVAPAKDGGLPLAWIGFGGLGVGGVALVVVLASAGAAGAVYLAALGLAGDGTSADTPASLVNTLVLASRVGAGVAGAALVVALFAAGIGGALVAADFATGE